MGECSTLVRNLCPSQNPGGAIRVPFIGIKHSTLRNFAIDSLPLGQERIDTSTHALANSSRQPEAMTQRKIDTLRILLLTAVILIAAMTRLIPHSWNFTPLGGIALLGAAYFKRKYLAFIVPFAALWLSDLILNNTVYAQYYPGFYWGGHPGTWLGFTAVILLGLILLRRINAKNIFTASVTGSVAFFLVSNFAVWIGSTVYPQNLAGLAAAYFAGLPFFWKTLAGFLLYSGLLFGAFEWVRRRFNLPVAEPVIRD